MEDGSPLCCSILAVVFIVLTGMMYGFYMAVESLNELTLEKLSQENNKKADKLADIVKSSSVYIDVELIVTMFLINFVAGICIYPVLQNGVHYLLTVRPMTFSANMLTEIVAGAIVVVLYTIVMMVFGVIVPKHYAVCNPEKWACRLLPVARFTGAVVTPFVFVIKGISKGVMLITGFDPDKAYDNVTEEEIVSMVNEGHEQGVFEANEAEMINNIIEFGDKNADDIMTHRKSIVAVDSKWTLSETLEFIVKENYSRFPVYREDIDNIIGILHLKDALRLSKRKENQTKQLEDITELLRDPVFIPETRNLNDLFKDMQSKKIHMVIVVDEYGQTAGIVAMEDILEEIVGNILDEYDEEDIMILSQDDGSYIMNGMAELDEVCEVLGITLEEDDEYDTLNGLLVSKLDRIPGENESPSIAFAGYQFDVLDVRKKIIQFVKVTRLEAYEEQDLEDKETEE